MAGDIPPTGNSAETAGNRHSRALARLLLNAEPQGRHIENRRPTMAKFENLTFSVGMALSSLLMFATLAPLA